MGVQLLCRELIQHLVDSTVKLNTANKTLQNLRNGGVAQVEDLSGILENSISSHQACNPSLLLIKGLGVCPGPCTVW